MLQPKILEKITPMKTIGLVGGIGSGKSTVAQIIGRREDAVVIDADRLGHDVLRLDEVKTLVRAEWGNTPFGEDGEIDRRKMATLVFSGTPESIAQLEKLIGISHPRIAGLLKKQIELAKIRGVKLVLLDAPLLLEGPWDQFCDRIIFIETPQHVRMERIAKRGWSQEEYHARAANQLPLEEKRKAAQFVLENDCSLIELEQRIDAILCQIMSE